MSTEIALRANGGMAVIALCLLIGVRVGVVVQVLWKVFVAAVKLADVTLRVVQEVGASLAYL